MKKFVLFTCLLLTLTVTACARDASKPTKETSSKTTRSKTAQSSAKPKSKKPLDKLAESFLKMGKVKSFRAKTTTFDAVQTITTEFQAPDRFHTVTAQLDASWTGDSTTSPYRLEGTFYKKVGDQWQKSEASNSDLQLLRDPRVEEAVDVKKLKTGLAAATTKKFMGNEVLDGEPTLVFEYTVDRRGQSVKTPWGAIYTFKIWIGVSDSLPCKLDISTQTGDEFPHTHPGYGSNTNYYDYNKNIKIEPPIK